MVCFDVVNMTVRTLNTGSGSRSAPAVRPEMLEQLISFDTVPELIDLLETFVEETCASMEVQPDAREERAQDMQVYITENCFDENFSLQAMADHFSLTPSNLSHYFKNCTGQGVLECVQALRKKKAAELLSGTDEPVQVIGERVGMPNVSSFIRFFKQQTGVTPGQYRRQARPSAPPSPGE
jgi:AraC-like DNA-binding protein